MNEEEIVSLIKRANAGDQAAIDELFQFFKPRVMAIARKYFLMGADFDDLLQEGMIGLYKAMNIYDGEKNSNFVAFAQFIIHRQLQTAVKNANRKKNAPLNTYLPIQNYDGSTSSEEDHILKMVIVDDNSDIEKNFIDEEMNTIVMSRIKEVLDDVQFQVLDRFLKGEAYAHIAKDLNITTKKVDNIIQAIKKKLKSLNLKEI